MNKNIFILIMCCCTMFSKAQFNLQWANTTSTGFIDADAVSLFSCGTIQNGNTNDISIKKIDLSGNIAWQFNYGSSTADEQVRSVKLVGDYFFVAGVFNGSNVDFDPGPAVGSFTSLGGYDVFVQKFDKDGNMLWTKTYGSASDEFSGGKLKPGANNSLVYWGSLTNAIPSLAKIDIANGNIAWTVNVSNLAPVAYDFTTDPNGNIYFTGAFGQAMDFDPSPSSTYILPVTGASIFEDTFIAKFDGNGTFQWARGLGTSNREFGMKIVADQNTVYIAAQCNSSGSFSFNTSTTSTSYSNPNGSGDYDTYIFKINSAGNLIFIKNISGLGSNDGPGSIRLDGYNNIYVAWGVHSPSGSVAFISKYSSDGGFLKQTKITYVDGYVTDLAVDANNYIYINGDFKGTFDADPGCSTFNLQSSGNNNFSPFLSKINQSTTLAITPSGNPTCSGANVTLTASGSSNYSWSPATGLSASTGSTVIASPPVTTKYTVTGTDATGCQIQNSIVINGINLNPDPVIYSSSTGPLGTAINIETYVGCSTGQVTYSLTNGTGSAELLGSVLTLTGVGTVTLTANVGADATHVAKTVTQTITITKGNQTIKFDDLGTKCLNTSFTLSAITSSGLPPSFTSSDPSIASIAGDVITIHSTGTVFIKATQDGNQNFNAATDFYGSGNGPAGVERIMYVNPLPTFVAPPSVSVCPGGSVDINISASSDAQFNTYNWSPNLNVYHYPNTANVSVSPTTTTIYTIVSTDGYGCNSLPQTVTANVLSPTLPTISGNLSPQVNTNINYTTENGKTNYLWQPGVSSATVVSGLSSTGTIRWQKGGTQTLSVSYLSSEGCTVTKSVAVNVSSPMCAGTISSPSGTNLCVSSPLGLSAGGGQNYLWNTGATSRDISVTSPGVYSASWTSSGCTYNASITIYQTGCAGGRMITSSDELPVIENTEMADDVTISPNPSTNIAILQLSKPVLEDASFSILNCNGVSFQPGKIVKGEDKAIIQTNELSNGMYIIKLNTGLVTKYFKLIVLH